MAKGINFGVVLTDNPSEESYAKFLTSSWSHPQFIEVRDQSRLVAVAVTDYVHQGRSAFYTLFDPAYRQNSLGTYGILQQISTAKKHDIPNLFRPTLFWRAITSATGD